MTYLALLRGINVGGNCKVEMPKLKALFEKLNLKEVKTYINSGNVIFLSSKSPKHLTGQIESAIVGEFGLQVPVIVRDITSIRALNKTIPSTWTNDKTMRTDVIFLWDEIDNANIMRKIDINPNIENVIYSHGALVWNIKRENVTKGNGIKLIKTDLYKKMTVRNINTVRRLLTLMEETTY